MASPKRNNHRDRMARIMAVSSTWTAKPMRTRLNPFITDFDRYWAERLGGAPPAKETRTVTTAVTEGALAPAVAEAAKAGLSKGDKAKISKIDSEINEILAARKGRKGAPPAAEKQKLADLRAKKAAILGEAPAPTPAQTATAIIDKAVKVTETAANNAADSVESIRLNIKAIEDYYAERGSRPGRPKAGFGKDDLKALKDKLAAAEAAAGAAATAADTVKDIADSAGVAGEAKPRRKPGRKPGPKPASTAAAAEEAKDLTGVAVEAAQEAQAHAEDVADEVDAAGKAEGVDLPVVDSVPEPLVQAGGVDSEAAKIAALTALLEAEDAKATPAQAVEAVKGVSPIPEDDEDEDPFAKIKQAMEQARKNPRRNSSDALPPVLKGYLVGQFKQMDPTLTDKQAESLFDFTNKSLNDIGVSRGTKTAAEYSTLLVGLISQQFNAILKRWRKQQAAAPAPAPAPVQDEDEDEDTSDEASDAEFDVEAADRLIRSLIDKEIEALLGTRANRSRSNFGRRNRF